MLLNSYRLHVAPLFRPSAMELDDPDLKAATWGSGEWSQKSEYGAKSLLLAPISRAQEHMGVGFAYFFRLGDVYTRFKSAAWVEGFAMAHKALKNYCVIQEMVKKKAYTLEKPSWFTELVASKIEVNQEEVQRLMQALKIESVNLHLYGWQSKTLPPTSRNGIGASAEDKRAYQKAVAGISNWDATDVQQLKELHVRSFNPDAPQAWEMCILFMGPSSSATIMNKRLNTLAVEDSAKVDVLEIDWMTVEPKEPSKGIKSKFVSGVKFASRTAEGKYTVNFIKQLGTNTILFFEDGEKGALKAAKKGGLHTSTEEDLNMESAKVELAMGNAVSDAAQGAAKVTAKSLHKDLNAGKLDSIDDAEEEIESVEESVCKTQRKTALQTLQAFLTDLDLQVFQQQQGRSGLLLTEPVRAPLMVDASTITTEAEETCEAPNLGIRGVGVSAAGLGAGLEEAPGKGI
ncbi:hypothetical protein AK812_SmicGene34891 [Symbiodinium microadriaticum]|uniref:Uncharacterized protein n=1 Tax=Symbiodinium microadriaticum TaxID=2951 RepID=A0A1Q9CMV6_SYMMI|nr:hypothetical protein AK812_SmicGene34891 [Symbiodinium microadriaticum]